MVVPRELLLALWGPQIATGEDSRDIVIARTPGTISGRSGSAR